MAFSGVQNFPQVFPKNHLSNMYHVAILCVWLIMACVYSIHLPKIQHCLQVWADLSSDWMVGPGYEATHRLTVLAAEF